MKKRENSDYCFNQPIAYTHYMCEPQALSDLAREERRTLRQPAMEDIKFHTTCDIRYWPVDRLASYYHQLIHGGQ